MSKPASGATIDRAAVREPPRTGTKMRALYDFFLAKKGEPVHFSAAGKAYWRIEYLRDFYGLDILRIDRAVWVLAGRWVGQVYIDFIAAKVA